MNIAVVGQPRPKKTTPLNAVEFTNALGRTIVRLIPNALFKAESEAMETVGMSVAKKVKVGYVVPCATGFVADSRNAQQALALVPDLQWAQRTVDTNGAAVKAHFAGIVKSWTDTNPQLAVALLTELARIFAHAAKFSQAKQYFMQARQVEYAHKLPISADRQAAIFTEFGGLGVVGAKELRAQLPTAELLSPRKAFAFFLRLNADMMRAGMGAYALLAADVRSLGAAAGFGTYESDHRLLEAVAMLPGFRRSDARFFQAIRESLAQFSSDNSEFRAVLRDLNPVFLDASEYLSMLYECEAMPADAGELLQWLRTVREVPDDQRLIDQVRALPLAGLQLEPRFQVFPVDLIDALCASGVVWEDDFCEDLRWSEWASKPDRSDLGGIYGCKPLRNWLATRMDTKIIADNIDAFRGVKLVTAKLNYLLKEKANVAGSASAWDRFQSEELACLLDSRFRELNPRIMKRLFEFDPVAELQLRISRGVLTELTWPELESTVAKTKRPVELHESYPGVRVRIGRRFEAVGPTPLFDAKPPLGTGPHYGIDGGVIEGGAGGTGAAVAQNRKENHGEVFEPLRRGTSIPGIKITGLKRIRIPADYRFLPEESTVLPVQPSAEKSLCGESNGAHIALVFGNGTTYRMVTPLGSFRADRPLQGAIGRPGGGVWLLSQGALLDQESGQPVTWVPTILNDLPPSLVHQLEPRNADMSAKMRAITAEQAAELLAHPDLEAIERIFSNDQVLGESLLAVVDGVQRLHSWFVAIDSPETDHFSEAAAAQLVTLLGHAGRGTRSTHVYQEADTLQRILRHEQENSIISASWLNYIGHEKAVVAGLAGAQLEPSVVVEICQFLLHATSLGIFGAGWKSYVVEAAFRRGWQHGAWCYNRNHVLAHPDHSDLSALGISAADGEPDLALTQAQFTHALGVIMAEVGRRKAQSMELAARTILLPETCAYLLGGFPKRLGEEMLTAAERGKYGLSKLGEQAAIKQLCGLEHLGYVLGAGVGERFPEIGLDINVMAAQLNQQVGKPIVHVTAEQFMQAAPEFDDLAWLTNSALSEVTAVPAGLDEYSAGDYLATVLHVISNTQLNDPARHVLGGKLRNLKTYGQQQLRAGEWETGSIELNFGYGDKKLNSFEMNTMPIRVLLEGHLDQLLTDLQADNAHAPAGDPHDPGISAPQVVAEVEQALGLGPDSARYFLQILTLTHPTDANIRAWNGWRKPRIDQAATPLVEKGLLVADDRNGAGRTRFLPGSWLAGQEPSQPMDATKTTVAMEAWKAPHYLLLSAAHVQPILAGCPPVQSLDRLFAATWQRYSNGDTP